MAQQPLRSNLELWFHFPLAIQSHDNTQGGDSAALAFPLCQGLHITHFSLYLPHTLLQMPAFCHMIIFFNNCLTTINCPVSCLLLCCLPCEQKVCERSRSTSTLSGPWEWGGMKQTNEFLLI